MHKLSDKVSQATHFLGGGKGYDTTCWPFVQHPALCKNPLPVASPAVADHRLVLRHHNAICSTHGVHCVVKHRVIQNV